MIHSTLQTILFQAKENNMKTSDSQDRVIFNQRLKFPSKKTST